MISEKILSPFQKFVNIESFSGILLMLTTILALVWANSPLSDSYQALWQYKIGFKTQDFELYKPLILWVNDGLMAIFFFLIGLEIKREFLIGELNSVKKLAFPLVGALGGMFVPVGLFILLNQNPDTFRGWGIPMATDIAFSLAVLKLLGDKVPLSLKVFLTAFAIVDDLGAVLVIALFYSGTIKLGLLITALILLAILYVFSYKGYYSRFVMIVFGIIIWTLFLKADIHPTLAGVLLAFSVPIGQKVKTPEFVENLEVITNNIKMASVLKKPILSAEQINEIDNLEEWSSKYQSPLQRLEHNLHNWVAYFIIPIFALANAGISINSNIHLDMALAINITVGLVIGKSLGISAIIFLSKKLKFIDIPFDISSRQIIGVSFLGGIGFTMSIFIASLAFVENPLYLDSAKIGILIGSLLSAICGYFILNTKSVRQKS